MYYIIYINTINIVYILIILNVFRYTFLFNSKQVYKKEWGLDKKRLSQKPVSFSFTPKSPKGDLLINRYLVSPSLGGLIFIHIFFIKFLL